LLGIISGLKSGGAAGDASAALSAGSLAAKSGVLGSSSGIASSALGAAGGILGLVNSVKQGNAEGAATSALSTAAAVLPALGPAAAAGAAVVAVPALLNAVFSNNPLTAAEWSKMTPAQQAEAYNSFANNPFSTKNAAYMKAIQAAAPGQQFQGIGANGMPIFGNTGLNFVV
jgi:hypothetical protein